MDGPKPHLVIGIDLGMTCTGVSYANLSIGSDTVRWIQKWPGRFQANENKVPTIVVYPTRSPQPSSWGFLSETVAETTAEDKEYKEWFKILLDPAKLAQKQREDAENAPRALADVEKWYEDYLRKLYEYVALKLGPELSRVSWADARIDFIFSVPTTWPVHPTVEKFRAIVKRAGYGEHRAHSVTIGLTEAEAAAVHVSAEAPGIFRERDILLVCDAGGGTTDLSILRVTETNSPVLSLQQLDVVFGETIGSAAIDYEFEMLVQSRLDAADKAEKLPMAPDDAAWEMMKSRDFQSVKCEHGSPDDTPLFSITIPKVSHTYSNAEAGIKNGEMTFSRAEMQTMFDKQIAKLFRLIDTQLESLQRKVPHEQVAHLVLSGGLGNSAYVQQQLRARYCQGDGSMHPNAKSIQVRIAPDPQLAVCKGLVADRVEKLRTQKSILNTRCCRASYGIHCRIRYNKYNPEHMGKRTTRDPLNRKLYITQAIAWFVKKGEAVSMDKPIVHEFIKRIPPGDPRRAFPTSIITSDVAKELLPTQMDPDTRVLCDIEADLSSADERLFIEKNKHFWSLGKRHTRVEYQIRVLVGPADICFELWFNGQKLSRDVPIKVEWADSPAALPVELSAEPHAPLQNGAWNNS